MHKIGRQVVVVLLSVCPSLAFACPVEKSIWVQELNRLRIAAYFPAGMSMSSAFVFEGWAGPKI